MVEWCIDTIFGAICVIVIVAISVVSHQPVQPKTLLTVPTLTPKPPKMIHFHQQQQTNTTISCQVPLQALAGHNHHTVTPTMATQHRCQTLVPLSWPKNQEMAPTTQGSVVCAKPQQATLPPCIISALRARYLWGKWWGRCGRDNGAKKGEYMGFHWQHKVLPFEAHAVASKDRHLPLYTKRGRLVYTYLGGWQGFQQKRCFCCPHHHHFCPFCGKTTKHAVCCWVYFDPVTHSKTHLSPIHNGCYL
jgi:hypothetical protein